MRYSIGAGSRAPLSTIGQRPPSASDRTSAPISLSGSRMRRIGRLRSEASPSKVAVIPWPPTTPIISRQPVPALPKSSVSRGAKSAPSPGPRIRHAPGPRRSMTAPSAWQALPVRSTSSPSSSPSTFVSPQARRPNRKARCEIDLSPGGRSRPFSGLERRALSGEAAARGDGRADTSDLHCRGGRAAQGGPRSYHRRWKLSTADPYTALTGRERRLTEPR